MLAEPTGAILVAVIPAVVVLIGLLVWRRRAAATAREATARIGTLEAELVTTRERNEALDQQLIELEHIREARAQELKRLNAHLSRTHNNPPNRQRTRQRTNPPRTEESRRLRGEIDRLKTELASRPGDVEIVPLGDDQRAQSDAKSLREAVTSLLNRQTYSALVVDSSGFPIVTAGLADDALAAFSVLLARPCERVTSFVALGDPYVISIIDVTGHRVSYWPFSIGDKQMALVTMSGKQTPTPAVNAAISKVKALLPRSFRSLTAAWGPPDPATLVSASAQAVDADTPDTGLVNHHR